ncbi:MAG: hypothetical protein SFU83_03960 [Meiothermus sp.]|nr:hypothetical protein [Meiothermus sp.]
MADWWKQARDHVQPHLGSLRVGVYASGGAPSHHIGLLALWGGKPTPVYADEIAAGKLSDFDAVIFPGGGLLAMAGQLKPMGAAGATNLRRWVESGGTYIGSCAGSCHPLRMSDPYLEAQPLAAQTQMCDLTPVNAAAGEWGLDSPGTGRMRVEAVPGGHPLLEGLESDFDIIHYNGPLFPPAEGTAGRVLEAAQDFTPFERSLGLEGETTFSRAVKAGARVAYRQAVGSGQIILFGSHPEFGASTLQLGWLPAARMLANALRLVPAGGSPKPARGELGRESLEHACNTATALRQTLTKIISLGEHLPDNTPPFLGHSGPALWNAAIIEAIQVLESLEPWLANCPTGSFEAPYLLDCEARPDQDFGFAGARQLLDRALEMARRAEATPPSQWPPFTGPYNEFLSHPYHLVAAVYLSAGGLVAGAALQAAAFAAHNGLPTSEFFALTA